jgi:hypothetical protein
MQNKSARSRLCITLDLGKSVQIGDETLTVACIASRPGFYGRDSYHEVYLWLASGPRIWIAENMEAYFNDYSVGVTKITPTKVRISITADPSIRINRLGEEIKIAEGEQESA